MPIYKMDGKKDGLQKYRVRINFTDSSGKSKQIDRVAYGKEVAKELERQLAYNLSDETIKRITLQQLYDEYIAVKKFEIRENSMRTIIGRLELYVLPKFKDYKLNKITSSELQKWKQYIETCTNAKKPTEKLSSSMKQNIFGEFRALMNYAVKMEYIPRNPLTVVGNFRNPYENKREMDFYPRPPALREPGHAGLCAGRSALPCTGAEPPGDVLPHDRGLPRRHQEAAADAARSAQRGGQRRRLPPHAPPADKAAQGCFRDAAALRLVSAELHPEVLRLRQVRESLPLRCAQTGGPARRPDPRGHHALEVQ